MQAALKSKDEPLAESQQETGLLSPMTTRDSLNEPGNEFFPEPLQESPAHGHLDFDL